MNCFKNVASNLGLFTGATVEAEALELATNELRFLVDMWKLRVAKVVNGKYWTLDSNACLVVKARGRRILDNICVVVYELESVVDGAPINKVNPA